MKRLQKAVADYLTVRRAMGFQLRDVERQLSKFISFLDERSQSHVTIALALTWVEQMAISPATKASRLGMVRHFAQYLSASDPRNEVPPFGLLPKCTSRKQPYIYSDDEIAHLLDVAQQIPYAAGFKAKTFSTLLGLLVVTGMRIGECLALNRDDLNLDEGMLKIVGAKFHKSRLIPLHPSTKVKLHEYNSWRDRIFPKPLTPSFLVSTRGTRLRKGNVRNTFIRLACKIGLRKPSDRHGPRLHDFRHRFAVKTLLNWYRSGVDVEQHIAELATYLGHVHVDSTYWYLTGTPELLRLVANHMDNPKKDKEQSHGIVHHVPWFAGRILHGSSDASGRG